MAKINKLKVCENVYTKDGKEFKFYNIYLDLSTDDGFRYELPLSCSDKGQLAKVLRVSLPSLVGSYAVNNEE